LIILITIIVISIAGIFVYLVRRRRASYVPDTNVPEPKSDCNLNKFVDDLDCDILTNYKDWIDQWRAGSVDWDPNYPKPDWDADEPVFRYVPGLMDSDVKMNGILDTLTCKKLQTLKTYRDMYSNKIITPSNYIDIIKNAS